MSNIAKKTNGSHFEPLTLDRLFRDDVLNMGRLFDPMFPEFRATLTASPLMNVYEKEGTYFVDCALPGIKKDHVKIDVSGNLLTITAESEKKGELDNVRFHRRDMYRNAVSGTVEFPEEIDADRVTAKLADGVLKLSVIPVKPVKHKAVAIAD